MFKTESEMYIAIGGVAAVVVALYIHHVGDTD